ncbi:hypothetical protein AB0E88_20510 [Streptomyces sp. NPDC028635]|uniref:hypothetical protein n=1 Tax=Streptomyces sp. NPDC028635 TaxID=3154800 RepID=UPI00340D1E5F
MPDRSLRLLTFPPHPARTGQTGERGTVLLRERPASPPEAPDGSGPGRGGKDRDDDNPFAPPPEGTPDRPWQPRHPAGGHGGNGHGGDGHRGDGHGGDGQGGGSPWGRWSDRQPDRSSGGFGERPGGGPERPAGGGDGNGPGMRWDPSNPVQRRARYALLAGMWAFFFALFGWPYVALLLGALALYWGISGLRGRARSGASDAAGRPQTTAAVSGLVTASLALALVAAGFASQLVYRDYYTCTGDALTNEAKQSCKQLLPSELRGFLGEG